MDNVKNLGTALRASCKEMVLLYMQQAEECQASGDGLSTSTLFKNCGLGWGEQESATLSNQQYWLVALLRALELEQLIHRNEAKKWLIGTKP